MGRRIREGMTEHPDGGYGEVSMTEAAKLMREKDLGAVFWVEGDEIKGVLKQGARTVGVVSLGDLAGDRGSASAE